MSVHFPRRRWAESGDWESVRSLITKMYKVEGRPLKEVMRIMETEHQFLATPKMYKKRIKDWAIDKNMKYDRLSTSPQSSQWRVAKKNDLPTSVKGAVVDAQSIGNYVKSRPGSSQNFQHDTLPSPEEATQGGYQRSATTSPLQQHNAGHFWTNPDQTHYNGSHSPPHAQSPRPGERDQTSALLTSIRDRFLEASDAITRHHTAGLFEILNPAYEAISQVAEANTKHLLTALTDLFELLCRRPNHQDMLRQLLHYVFALVPDAVRRDRFLSCDNQVLALLGRPGYDSASSVPLDTASDTFPGPAVSRYEYNYHTQPSSAGLALGNGFGGDCRQPS